MQCPAHVIDPGDALQAEALLAERIDANRGETLLDGLLEDERLGHLDEGRVRLWRLWHLGLLHASSRPSRIVLLGRHSVVRREKDLVDPIDSIQRGWKSMSDRRAPAAGRRNNVPPAPSGEGHGPCAGDRHKEIEIYVSASSL